MEDNLISQEPSNQNLTLNPTGISHLKETRAWTNFISILSFVFLGLLLIAGFAGGAALSGLYPSAEKIGSGIWLIIILIMVAIYFFPIYFLFNFSRYSKLAITKNDHSAFIEAMRYLKLHYRYIGIFMIVICSIYLLVIIFALMAGSMVNMFTT